MKRFKLQSGHVIKIDDADAYLMRSYVWNCKDHGNAGLSVRRSCGSGTQLPGQYVLLGHELMSPPGDHVVLHIDGDYLNFQRANLQVAPRSEMTRRAHQALRRKRIAEALAVLNA